MRAVPVALFDFDGTLCPGDSIVPYLRFCVAQGAAPWHQPLRAGAAWLRQLARPQQVLRSKEQSLSFLKGQPEARMDELARRFWREVLLPRCFPEGLAQLDACRRAGQLVLVLSASASCYMRVLPEFLPAAQVISTRCETAAGRYTGRIEANCRGEEKARAAVDWLAQQGLCICRETSAAYGNSLHDAQLLSLVGQPMLVNADAKLAARFPGAKAVRWR